MTQRLMCILSWVHRAANGFNFLGFWARNVSEMDPGKKLVQMGFYYGKSGSNGLCSRPSLPSINSSLHLERKIISFAFMGSILIERAFLDSVWFDWAFDGCVRIFQSKASIRASVIARIKVLVIQWASMGPRNLCGSQFQTSAGIGRWMPMITSQWIPCP